MKFKISVLENISLFSNCANVQVIVDTDNSSQMKELLKEVCEAEGKVLRIEPSSRSTKFTGISCLNTKPGIGWKSVKKLIEDMEAHSRVEKKEEKK